MNTLKVLVGLSLMVLISLSSCTPNSTETITDPKIGVWKETTAMGVVTLTFTADKKMTLQLAPTGGVSSLATSNWVKDVSENVYIYENISIVEGTTNIAITEPYIKLKVLVNGNSADVTFYEATTTVGASEAMTTIIKQATVTKQ